MSDEYHSTLLSHEQPVAAQPCSIAPQFPIVFPNGALEGASASVRSKIGGVVPPDNLITAALLPSNQLQNALWRSPHRHHQIGVLDRQTKLFKNIPVKDAAEAVKRALKLSNASAEAYFACAEFLTPDSRGANNASGAWGFWMDLDCGEVKAEAGKGYRTVEDAEQAIEAFCSDTGLPSPTHIVDSGGGLHVYWATDGEIERDVWRAYASKLKALTRAHKFLADDSRTSDIASVLRIPGTFNHKYSPPKLVSLKYASNDFIGLALMLDAIFSAYGRIIQEPTKPSPIHTAQSARPPVSAGQSRYGAPDLAKLESALAVLDPDCDEETWKLRRLAPMAGEARKYPDYCEALYEMAKSWSSGELRGIESKKWRTPGGNGLTGEDFFEVTWQRFLTNSYDGTPVTLGTIYFDAKAAGWCTPVDPAEQFSRIDAEEGDA
jgi:hypothetical protein